MSGNRKREGNEQELVAAEHYLPLAPVEKAPLTGALMSSQGTQTAHGNLTKRELREYTPCLSSLSPLFPVPGIPSGQT